MPKLDHFHTLRGVWAGKEAEAVREKTDLGGAGLYPSCQPCLVFIHRAITVLY